MRFGKNVPGWAELVVSWKAQQDELRARTRIARLSPLPRFVAGVDCAFANDQTTVFAAAVVYDRIDRRIVEARHATAPAEVPYVPGFLSFREGPAIFAALKMLEHLYGVICFDGQGIAHPRRCGLATHVAVTLDVPGIGCAKSRFIGTFDEPSEKAGSFSPLMDGNEQIGAVLRTRDGIRPMFISPGHRVDLASSIELVMSCCLRRVPEPTRQADIEVAKLKLKFR